MKVGVVIDESWAFLNEIYADFEEHHTTSLFQPRQMNLPVFQDRFNRFYQEKQLQQFLQLNNVVFFEWASHLLAQASNFRKSCGIVTRLHRYEMYQWVDRIHWEVVDKIILVSQAKRKELLAKFPELEGKIEVVPEAVSLHRFQMKRRSFRGDIGILCHMAPRKRVYELILVFSELIKVHSQLHLHIGGGPRPMHPDYYPSLLSLVNRLGLDENVTFYGRIEDPTRWYHNIDIYISNSYSEGLQVSPIEAMASGCYCLSHWWDGANELLPNTNLYFTDRELIEKLEEYIGLSDVAKERRCSFLRSEVERRFDVDKTKVEIRRVLEEAAETWDAR
jgi:glycosyltransferase involved in cell wall biosynthesis